MRRRGGSRGRGRARAREMEAGVSSKVLRARPAQATVPAKKSGSDGRFRRG
jgi:hypothetical protein